MRVLKVSSLKFDLRSTRTLLWITDYYNPLKIPYLKSLLVKNDLPGVVYLQQVEGKAKSRDDHIREDMGCQEL